MNDPGNQRLQLFFHQSPLGFIEWNKEWKVIGWNSAASAIFEFTEQEALGIDHLQIIPFSDHVQVNQVINRLEKNRGGRFSENNNITKSGKVIRCRWYNTILLDDNGEQIGAASVVQDITKEVEAQKRLLSYYERLNEFSHNLLEISQRRTISGERLGTTIRELTEFGAKALKVERASSWLFNQSRNAAAAITCFDTRTAKHTSGDTLNFSDYPAYFDALLEERCIAAEKARTDPRTKEFLDNHFIPQHIYGKLAIVVRKKGESTGMLCFEHGDPTRAWEPEEILFVTALSDLTSLALEERERSIEETKRKRLEEQLFQSQKLEALGSLAGGIAHDFNNLLSAILGSVELAELRLQANQDIRPQFQTIHQAGGRARELVKQILTFSRKAPMTLEPVILEDVVETCLTLLKATLPPSLKLLLSLQSKESLILGSVTQLHQVLINLVTNASHAIGDIPGEITIGTTIHSFKTSDIDPLPHISLKPGPHIELWIKDSGHGISEKILSSIFDPFFTTKDTGKGTGLGLSIVHTIIKNLNGAITVESTLERGTTFHMYFPIIEAEKVIKKVESSVESALSVANHKKIVLVVDDEVPISNYLRELFSHNSIACEVFNRPDDALRAFEKEPSRYGLIITDLMMPIMTGITLTEKIKRLSSTTPVILFSGHPLPERFTELGISLCLPKPIEGSVLLEAVAKLLHK